MWRILHLALLFLMGTALGCVEPDLYVTGTGESTEPPREESPSAVIDSAPGPSSPTHSP